MITAAAVALALFAFDAGQTPSTQDPFRGSDEGPKLNHSSTGFTLDKLNGLPMTRPVVQPPQVRAYPQPVVVYPANPYGTTSGLGGYNPPRPSGYPRVWGAWWVR